MGQNSSVLPNWTRLKFNWSYFISTELIDYFQVTRFWERLTLPFPALLSFIFLVMQTQDKYLWSNSLCCGKHRCLILQGGVGNLNLLIKLGNSRWYNVILGKMVLGWLKLSFSSRDATDQIYFHLGEGGGNTHQKNRSIPFDLIFPSTLLLLKGS